MILRTLKEKIGIFKREQETKINWPEVKVECAVDDEGVPCNTIEDAFYAPEAYGTWGAYTGVPAPAYLPDDDWFGPAPIRSEKQIDYMERETEYKMQEEQKRQESGGEPDNIHELMYQMSMSSGETTIQRDPIGGSETFQEGPGGWQSGVGR